LLHYTYFYYFNPPTASQNGCPLALQIAYAKDDLPEFVEWVDCINPLKGEKTEKEGGKTERY
jgi:hypothetical protein